MGMVRSRSSSRERRDHPRVHTGYEARVRFSGGELVRAQVPDLSRSGAFVEFFPLNLPEGEPLELVLVQRERSPVIRIYRYPAIVIRRSFGGVGIAFVPTSWLRIARDSRKPL
ncbi:MAG: PilZ domain-containing protein [Gammaproteobacteria bacterium]|nr:PilZ domain-containing protein [Gammaproteobacteria bacterium]